jgi:hydroxymethylpyrimidine pyrophosphatase-like HAD family hydrolase
MDNAPALVKREAKMIAPSNDEDGVARVLEKLMECA